MIRVTFGNNKQFDFIHYYCVPNQIGLVDKFEQTEYYPYDSIKRVEKQVKDLSLEECKKLGLCGVDLYKGGVWFNEPMKEHIDYYDDDYIDITDFVKRT